MTWLIVEPGRAGQARKRFFTTLLLAFVLPIAAVIGVNTVRTGNLAFISSNGPYNFFMGNVHDGSGVTVSQSPTYLQIKASAPAVEIDLMREGMRQIVEHPGAWLRLCVKKVTAFFGPAELANNLSYDMTRKTNPRTAWAPVEYQHLMVPAILGLVIGLRSRRRYAVPLLLGASYAAATLPFIVPSRLRQPMVVVILVLAAVGIHGVVRKAIELRSTQRLALLATASSLWLISTLWLRPEPDFRSVDYLMAGAAYAERAMDEDRAGRPGPALELYRRAVALNPEHAVAVRRATQLAVPPSSRKPEVVDLGNRARRLVEDPADAGRAAEKLLRRAMELDPYDPQPARYLANVLYLRQDLRGATEALEIAVERAPWNAQLRRDLVQIRRELLRPSALPSKALAR